MQRRLRPLAVLTTAAAALLSVAACTATPGGGSSTGGSGASTANIASLVQADQKTTIDDVQKSLGNPTAKPDTKLCYVTRTLANEFWGFERDGFESEAQKLGVQYQTFAVNDEASISEQLDKAQSALNQGCTTLLASPISATALDSVFTSALAKGVPAIVLNDAKSTLPGVVYIGPDAEAIGQSAADYIAQQLPDGGKVAMIEGDPGSSNALNRGKGFKEGLTKHPNLNLVASQTAKWDTNQAQTVATAMLTANPDIKAFYSQNDTMAFGVQAAVDAKGLTGQVIIVGTDGIPQAKKQIADGAMTATVSERPTTEGAAGVQTALWLLDGKQVPGWVDVPAFHALTIAKAFAFGAKIVALDEPTTSMLEHNVEAVLDRVRQLAAERDIGVIFVSHKMPEVMAVSDRVVVLRDGRVGFESSIAETSTEEIVRNMVGRELLGFRRAHPVQPDAPVLFTATGVTRPDSPVSNDISVRAGEVVGIAGLVGSGRTEFLRALVRADPGCGGTLVIDGEEVTIHSPNGSRDAGIAFIPEDRKRQGLALQMPAYANIALTAAPDLVGTGPFISPRHQIKVASELGTSLSLRPADVRLRARQYSGGNQQKLVIAKWLRRGSRVFLFDEPTKGVDVGGKAEIYGLIDELAAAGNAVVVVSSDLPEIISVSDRVLVMRNDRFISEHVGDDINEHSLVASAMGIAAMEIPKGTP